MDGGDLPSHDPTAAAATLDQKRAAMLERLSHRHNSRLTSTPQHKPATPLESTQSFLSRFAQSKLSIESQISQIQQNPNSSQKSDLDQIPLLISALDTLIAENSYFLPPYEVRTCLAAVDSLRRELDDVTSLVVPKKKFSFKNKPSSKKSSVIPAGNEVVLVREEIEKKVNAGSGKVGFGFRDMENEVLEKEFSKSEAEGQNGEFTLSGLRGCEVRLKGRMRALFVDKLVKCRVYVGAVMGSVLIEGAEGCVFVLGAHQIRIHNAKDCDFYLRVRSRPIIEDSCGVRFAPYCLSYDRIEGDLEEANLGEETGNWANVDDFRWLRAAQSPNWSVLPENERIGMVVI